MVNECSYENRKSRGKIASVHHGLLFEREDVLQNWRMLCYRKKGRLLTVSTTVQWWTIIKAEDYWSPPYFSSSFLRTSRDSWAFHPYRLPKGMNPTPVSFFSLPIICSCLRAIELKFKGVSSGTSNWTTNFLPLDNFLSQVKDIPPLLIFITGHGSENACTKKSNPLFLNFTFAPGISNRLHRLFSIP